MMCKFISSVFELQAFITEYSPLLSLSISFFSFLFSLFSFLFLFLFFSSASHIAETCVHRLVQFVHGVLRGVLCVGSVVWDFGHQEPGLYDWIVIPRSHAEILIL
jgi:hypothetical protein